MGSVGRWTALQTYQTGDSAWCSAAHQVAGACDGGDSLNFNASGFNFGFIVILAFGHLYFMTTRQGRRFLVSRIVGALGEMTHEKHSLVHDRLLVKED